MSRTVVFSDLDGTLLSHHGYDWSPALPALEALRRRGIPLVLASSKSRFEMEGWRRKMGNEDPFLSENGGAVFVPEALPLGPIPGAARFEGYWRVELGTPYARLRAALAEISYETGVPLRGFGDMTVEEVRRRTGLPAEDAARAIRREYDEPFVADRETTMEELDRLHRAAAARGLRLTRGGRFLHLLGRNDKGRAARFLSGIYAAGGTTPVTLGLGDGDNDVELLRVVDRPVVVARPDGSHAPGLLRELPLARFTRASGPGGFSEAILEWLREPW